MKMRVDGIGVFEESNIDQATYDGIDFGNGVEDSVHWICEANCWRMYKLRNVLYILADTGADPPPGVYDVYKVIVRAREDTFTGYVTDAVRDTLVAALEGPGSEDTRIEFNTVEGQTVHVYTKNVSHIRFVPDQLQVPLP
jgi:hypothetical protein